MKYERKRERDKKNLVRERGRERFFVLWVRHTMIEREAVCVDCTRLHACQR